MIARENRSSGGARQRDVRFELLRIFAMLLIVCCHLVAHSGWQLESLPGWKGALFLAVDNYVGQVGVALFLLISGYFLVEKEFSWWRVVRTVSQTWCYSALLTLLIFVVSTCTPYFNWLAVNFNGRGECVRMLFLLLLPTLNGEYWFIRAYVLMLLMSPFLNMVLRSASRRQLQALIGFLVFLSIMPYISLQLGPKSFLWTPLTYAITLYVVGGWIRMHGLTSLRIRCWHLLAYAVVSFALLVVLLNLWKEQSWVSRFFSWDPGRMYGAFPALPVLLSMGIMEILVNQESPRPPRLQGWAQHAIKTVASAMLGVYLIHQHVLFSSVIWYVMDRLMMPKPSSIVLSIGVFVVSLPFLFVMLTAVAVIFDYLVMSPVQAMIHRIVDRR